MPSFTNRLQHAWNAFMGRDPTPKDFNYGYSSSIRLDRPRLSPKNERSVVTTVYTRLSVDVAAIAIQHVKVDENDRYTETVRSGLNNVLTCEANIDQTGRAFIQDIVLSMFDEGCVAVVPTDTKINPNNTSSFDIEKMRTGRITQWFPEHVRVNVYNEHTGQKEDIILPKKIVAIIENPFYSIMNEPNSTLQRLIRTLNDLDLMNKQNASGKLDLIVQLPYVIKSQSRKEQAEARRKEIEAQLVGSKYGIAYTDGTERITQLNRPVENTLWTQVKELTSMLYNQLGLSEEILNGTADEAKMNNYYNHTIEPILEAIVDEFERKFLSKTARTQGQAIRYFRDPFKLVTVTNLADISDKLTRNEIAAPNEIRAIIGWKPSKDPAADELRNRNINQAAGALGGMMGYEDPEAMPEEEAVLPDDSQVEEEPRDIGTVLVSDL